MRSRRKALGLLLDDVAREVDSNISTLSRIENGRRSPTVDELNKIAVALRCTARDLVPAVAPRAKKRGSQH